MASIEVNDILFCQEHFAEVCDECCVDLREENDSFYGVVCNEHDSATCSQCFNWKKQISRKFKEAAKHQK
ncbi:hypothetical protein FPSE_03270 [Fusarium pseudograminearum CS3096]|uniref:Uncharacterized protein n=1 Tax=Fusarium pseudograminearum (strain CS3096) TaxID=1028729 RepID=K3W1U5_FUSPC|nr:hypothetical protein FPSE_03270 [Fusarium pseudograminearum CS3096]EKJ76510.1 hypothetical protein FPSE_03270 [Fusarium pseudograminearum CS3096]